MSDDDQKTKGFIWINSINRRDNWAEVNLPYTPLVWRSPTNGDKWYVFRDRQGLPRNTFWWLQRGSGHVVSTDFSDMVVKPVPGIPDFPVPVSEMSFMEDDTGASYADQPS